MPSHRKIKAGIIGFGRMGEMYLNQMIKSHQWEISAICDTDPDALAIAANLVPAGTLLTSDENRIFEDPSIEVVVLATLADSRKKHIFKAVEQSKHVITEKPLGSTIEEEKAVLEKLQDSRIMISVNLPLRTAWYHKTIKDFITTGEIGDLAIVRVCHMTPGLAPGEGHWAEGPLFHDCGMHYVDIAQIGRAHV